MFSAPPYRVRGPVDPACPVVLSVPHAGRDWTAAMASLAAHPPSALRALEDRWADRLADEAVAAGYTVLEATVPRAWIDLNRAPDEYDGARLLGEAAAPVGARAAAGLGVVPDRLPGLGSVWHRPPSRAEIRERVAAVHEPYHLALGRLLDQARARWGEALLIDVHSMPASGAGGADIVLGTRNGRSIAVACVAAARAALVGRGRRVAIDRPYAGAHIAARHGHPAEGRHALQLEVCRPLYLDRVGTEVGGGLPRCQADVLAVARELSDLLTKRLPLAAE